MKKSLENLYCHNSGLSIYDMDYDGMGNQGRCPKPKVKNPNRILKSFKQSLNKIKNRLILIYSKIKNT